MRLPSAFALLALAGLAVAGCSTPCQELGNRMCQCVGGGTTRSTCEATVKDEVSRLNPSKSVEDVCRAKLDTCNQPPGADFCEWILTTCGKAACGLSLDDPSAACAQ